MQKNVNAKKWMYLVLKLDDLIVSHKLCHRSHRLWWVSISLYLLYLSVASLSKCSKQKTNAVSFYTYILYDQSIDRDIRYYNNVVTWLIGVCVCVRCV